MTHKISTETGSIHVLVESDTSERHAQKIAGLLRGVLDAAGEVQPQSKRFRHFRVLIINGEERFKGDKRLDVPPIDTTPFMEGNA